MLIKSQYIVNPSFNAQRKKKRNDYDDQLPNCIEIQINVKKVPQNLICQRDILEDNFRLKTLNRVFELL